MAATLRMRDMVHASSTVASRARVNTTVVARAARARKSSLLQRIEEASNGVRGAAESAPAAAPVTSRFTPTTRPRASTPTRRGGAADRFSSPAQDRPAPSAPAAPKQERVINSARKGTAWKLAQGSDSSSAAAPAPSRTDEPSFTTPTRARRAGAAARFGGADDSPAASTATPTRARRGATAAKFGGSDDDTPAATTPTRASRGTTASKYSSDSSPAPSRVVSRTSAAPAKSRKGGLAAKFGL